METKFVADTHALLWYLTADTRLGANAKIAVQDPKNQIIIPAIVVAEALYIIEHGKSPASTSQLWDFIQLALNVTFYPLDLPVLKKSETLLDIPEMHDRQIVATALALQGADQEVVIVTRDDKIKNSGLVRTIW